MALPFAFKKRHVYLSPAFRKKMQSITGHSVDGRNSAPPKKPWNGDFVVLFGFRKQARYLRICFIDGDSGSPMFQVSLGLIR